MEPRSRFTRTTRDCASSQSGTRGVPKSHPLGYYKNIPNKPTKQNIMKNETIENITAGILGGFAACCFAVVTTYQPAQAGGVVYHDNNKTTVYRGGYYAPVAPHKTTVKHNDKKDTVKVCREYIYGTKNCAKWSY